MTEREAIAAALAKHPECTFAKADYGLRAWDFAPTWSVSLWRDEDLYLEEDPPRHVVEGFSRDSKFKGFFAEPEGRS
jgi:hypothetical protein